MCLSSLFKKLWPFENSKMYRNVLKIHFLNGQNSLENVSISLKLDWQMLLWILWNGLKIWILSSKFELKKILNWKKFWTEKNFWKKKFFGSEHVSSQIWCQKIFPFSGGGGSPQKKVAQNELKHILVLEFLRYDHFLGGGGSENYRPTSRQTSGHHSDQISRSALRDGATKNNNG